MFISTHMIKDNVVSIINSIDEERLKRSALMGGAASQNLLGGFYWEKGDLDEAFNWLKKAADQGAPELQFCFAAFCHQQEDYYNAVEYYKKAANQGSSSAQFTLGMFYYEGLGVEQDISEAVEFFKIAYASTHPTALTFLNRVAEILREDINIIPADSLLSKFSPMWKAKRALLSDVETFIKHNPPKHILPENPLQIH